MNKTIFTGVATALVTPFFHNEPDFSALERLLDLQLEASVPALVISGTTGEGSTLSREEKASLWNYAVRYINGHAKVIAGVGTNNTQNSINLAQEAKKCGVDALLTVTPYYNKCSQQGLIAHYSAIADATDLPLILYNVPSRTGMNLLPETCLALSNHPRIAGVKEAGGNISQAAKIRSLCPDFSLWSGNDDQIVPIMSLGGSGVISVLSNIRPKAVVEITDACLQGDYKRAAELQCRYLPLIDALFSDVNPIPVKAALSFMGLCNDELRLPLTPLSAEKRKKLLSAMEACN